MLKLYFPIALCLVLALPDAGNAQQTLESFSQGHVSSFQTITFDPITEASVLVGRSNQPELGFTEDFANFAVFDLQGNSAPVESAFLEYFLTRYVSADAEEEFAVFDWTQSDLPTAGEMSDFSDLSSGVQFGVTTVRESDEGSFVRVDLNSFGVDEINSNLGGLAVFGGAIATLAGDTNTFLFGETSSPRLTVVTSAVPEPSSSLIQLLAAIGIATIRTRRN